MRTLKPIFALSLCLLALPSLAANEFKLTLPSPSSTAYVVLVNQATGQYLNGTTPETETDAHWSNYAIVATQVGTTGTAYASAPTGLPAGAYTVYEYVEATPGTVSETNDGPPGAGANFYWTGTAEVTTYDAYVNALAANTQATAGTTRVTAALPSAAPGSSGGLLTSGTGAGQLSPSGGTLTGVGLAVTQTGVTIPTVTTVTNAVTLPSTAPTGYGGSGSAPTVAQIAAGILATPANLLATNSSGQVVASSVAGNVTGSVASVTGAVGSVTANVTAGNLPGDYLSSGEQTKLTSASTAAQANTAPSWYTAPANPATISLDTADEQVMGDFFNMISANKFTTAALSNAPSGGGGGSVTDTSVANDVVTGLTNQGYTTGLATGIGTTNTRVALALPAVAPGTAGGLLTGVGGNYASLNLAQSLPDITSLTGSQTVGGGLLGAWSGVGFAPFTISGTSLIWTFADGTAAPTHTLLGTPAGVGGRQ